ncbi:MAG TPA: 1-acyl-sn-glycerol-3-phosphate acyltransferase, partial [Verrucomicrobiae bacterium]
LAGTVFVDRRKRTRVGQATEKIENLLRTRVVTVLFPEGTSSDGSTMLPFKSALLDHRLQHNAERTFVVR